MSAVRGAGQISALATIRAVLAFEVARRRRMLSTYVYALVFFALAFLFTLAAGGAFASAKVAFGSEKVFVNAPFAIMMTVAFLGALALPVISSTFGSALQQDYEQRTAAFFATAPIWPAALVAGRFLSALLFLSLTLASISAGVALATVLPFINEGRAGSPGVLAYVWPYLVVLLPNLVLQGVIFFSLGALTRRMLPVYVGSAVMLMGYLAATALLQDVENRTLSSLLDPFAISAIGNTTEYWSVSERNTRLVPLTGMFLVNRLLWIGIALLIAALAWWRWRSSQGMRAPREARSLAARVEVTPPSNALWRTASPGSASALGQWWQLTRLNLRETLRNPYFLVLLLTGVLFVAVASREAGVAFGTKTYPVTYQMVELMGGDFALFMLIIITFFAGELVWRERDHGIDALYDAAPVPTWVPMLAKLAALLLVPLALQAAAMLAGIALQLARGFTHIELGVYLRGLFGVQLLHYWLLCVLAYAVHVLVNRKFLGHFIMVAYFAIVLFAPTLGWEHHLYRVFRIGRAIYSDMNGWGHFLTRVRWLELYWASLGVVLLVAASLFWQRGTSEGWRARLVAARARLSRPLIATALTAGATFAASGAYIFYNTNVLNTYRSSTDLEAAQARYEKTYRHWLDKPQPQITAVNIAVDLFPSARVARARTTLQLVNPHRQPVDEVLLTFTEGDRNTVHAIAFAGGATLVDDDLSTGVRHYRLNAPLQPGAASTLKLDVEWAQKGFDNAGRTATVVDNGTFINGRQLVPSIGYVEAAEPTSDSGRQKHGLPLKPRLPPRDDVHARQRHQLTADAHWIGFEAIVSTVPEQIAIAPGYLQREWQAEGRRYFHYKMDQPILNFYAFQSARYAVKRDRWNDVALEIYHHADHTYNLDRMMQASKDSLDYFTRTFGPYQHKQFRIVEFPRYERFAQAFPNTIPYSEAIGFIARVDDQDEKDIDYPFYVTAHEMAHQWWAHQVVGANVQGATMITESLAQYSSLMVMKRRYGDARIKRFLRYELDRYLQGRGTEQKLEVPLARVENQAYIHYAKGSLAMYALQDYLGEENVGAAIRRFRDRWAFKGPPYPTTHDLLAEFRALETPATKGLVDDLFEHIVTFENRTLSAAARRNKDRTYEVTIKVAAKKSRVGGLGEESEVPMHDAVDIGVLDEKGVPLFLEKRTVRSGESSYTVQVKSRPARAGIDPLNKLIDRTPTDNVQDVVLQE